MRVTSDGRPLFTGDSTCTTYSSVGLNPYNHTYSYNSIHNLTGNAGVTQGFGSGNGPGSGDAGPHAIVSAGSTSFGYDNNGNRISKTASGQTTTYTYNADNRLVTVDLPSDPNDVVFVYDADGARVRRAKGNYSTVYIAGLMEIDRNGGTVTQTRTSYVFAGTPVATRTHVNPETILVFDDHLGSSHTAWIDTTNAVIRLRYFPWGKERGSTGSWPSDRRFTGQISDDTGAASGDIDLLFYSARYYDPATGGFVAADTIVPDPSHPADLNRYAYVRNNPINHTDPSGNVLDLAIRMIGEHSGADPRFVSWNQRTRWQSRPSSWELRPAEGAAEFCVVACVGVARDESETFLTLGCCSIGPRRVKGSASTGSGPEFSAQRPLDRGFQFSAELCMVKCWGGSLTQWKPAGTDKVTRLDPEAGHTGWGTPGLFVGARVFLKLGSVANRLEELIEGRDVHAW